MLFACLLHSNNVTCVLCCAAGPWDATGGAAGAVWLWPVQPPHPERPWEQHPHRHHMQQGEPHNTYSILATTASPLGIACWPTAEESSCKQVGFWFYFWRFFFSHSDIYLVLIPMWEWEDIYLWRVDLLGQPPFHMTSQSHGHMTMSHWVGHKFQSPRCETALMEKSNILGWDLKKYLGETRRQNTFKCKKGL